MRIKKHKDPEKRKVKVMNMPATWILVDSKKYSNKSDEEIKQAWLEKHAIFNRSPNIISRKMRVGKAKI